MALLNILQFPDPRLKLTAESVTDFSTELPRLIDDMFETMYEAVGVGLAATQVNIQQRIIVIDVSEHHKEPLCLINPTIVSKEGTTVWEEGCLSFPGVYAQIQRAKTITLSYRDPQNTLHTLEADGLLGICIQHELDHLNGITFFDHLSPLKQSMMRKKLSKIRKKTL